MNLTLHGNSRIVFTIVIYILVFSIFFNYELVFRPMQTAYSRTGSTYSEGVNLHCTVTVIVGGVCCWSLLLQKSWAYLWIVLHDKFVWRHVKVVIVLYWIVCNVHASYILPDIRNDLFTIWSVNDLRGDRLVCLFHVRVASPQGAFELGYYVVLVRFWFGSLSFVLAFLPNFLLLFRIWDMRYTHRAWNLVPYSPNKLFYISDMFAKSQDWFKQAYESVQFVNCSVLYSKDFFTLVGVDMPPVQKSACGWFYMASLIIELLGQGEHEVLMI